MIESPGEGWAVWDDRTQGRYRPGSPLAAVIVLFVALPAAGLTVVGSLLPYVTVEQVSDGITYSVTGNGWATRISWADGRATAVLDGILLVVAALMLAAAAQWGAIRQGTSSGARVLGGIGSGLLVGTVAYTWLGIAAQSQAVSIVLDPAWPETATLTVEAGAWTLLAAAALALLAAVLMFVPAGSRPVDNS